MGLFAGLFLLFSIRNWGRLHKSFVTGFTHTVAAGPFWGLAAIFFILSLKHTTIATTMMTLSATPLIVAAVAYLLLHEKVTWATLVTMVVAGIGISLMAIDSVAIGTGLGSLFAVANVVSVAIYIVMVRRGSRGRNLDMLPAGLIGALVAVC